MRVLLTGAFGRVGSAIVEHLGDHDAFTFTYLDVDPHPDHDTIVADIADYDAIRPAFENQDAVIHLAAIPDEAPWPDLLRNNLIGTYNAYRAASVAGVDSFLFASSNHVMSSYQFELAPELYHPDFELLLSHTDRPRPGTIYGVTKLFGEDLGRYFIDQEAAPKRCYSLRICGTRHAEDDHPWGDAERGALESRWERGSLRYWEAVAKRMAMGTSRRDFAHAIECCLRDETVSYDTFFITSDNPACWFDIDHTKEVLGYVPRDDMSAWTGPVPESVPRELPANPPDWLPGYVTPP